MIDNEGLENRKREDVGGSDLRPYAEKYEEAALRSSMYRLLNWSAEWMKRTNNRYVRHHPEGGGTKKRKYRPHRDGDQWQDEREPHRSVK